jgi:LCP family protein required for cell wall assembly
LAGPKRFAQWRGRRLLYLPRASALIAGFLVAGLLGAGAYFLPVFQVAATSATLTDPLPAPAQPFTVLLLGSDDDAKFAADRYNTQSMILLRIDPHAKQATMLSIPRDLWVPIPGHGTGKISTAFQLGGSQLAVKAVESNFKIHIDDYVWIGLTGLVNLIDRIGGVDLLVTNPVMDDFYPADIRSKDPWAYHRVAVLPGAVHLDGAHALQYVRSRHGDLRGDFGRSERQQQLLVAIKGAHLNAADLPFLASAFNGEIKTSIGLDRMRQLLALAGQLGGSGVDRVVLVPPYTSEDVIAGQDAVIPHWNLILPLVHRAFP